MKQYLLVALALLPVNSAIAATEDQSQWQFPTNIKTMCMDSEQRIVSMYKAMIENNREMLDKKGEDNRERYQISNSYKQGIVEYEESWQRLGCASILYGK